MVVLTSSVLFLFLLTKRLGPMDQKVGDHPSYGRMQGTIRAKCIYIKRGSYVLEYGMGMVRVITIIVVQ